MLPVPVVPLQTGVPDWLALAVVVASVALAVLTLSLMLVRLRPAPDEEHDAPVTVRDPVLLLSIVCVIALAVAAWLLR
ncbi:MAG TPA: hypothetical protein VFV93_09675 [Thermomicrobiales bacterium]|nr:hypothetical protein [Thermomicrobiales bacterium]